MRFAALAAPDGRTGLLIVAPDLMEFSVSRYAPGAQFRAGHQHELKPDRCLHLKLDYRQRGVGTAGCGPDTRSEYRTGSGVFRFRYLLYPYRQGASLPELARAAAIRR